MYLLSLLVAFQQRLFIGGEQRTCFHRTGAVVRKRDIFVELHLCEKWVKSGIRKSSTKSVFLIGTQKQTTKAFSEIIFVQKSHTLRTSSAKGRLYLSLHLKPNRILAMWEGEVISSYNFSYVTSTFRSSMDVREVLQNYQFIMNNQKR